MANFDFLARLGDRILLLQSTGCLHPLDPIENLTATIESVKYKIIQIES